MKVHFSVEIHFCKYVAQSVWKLGDGLDDRYSVPGRRSDGNFSLHHCVKTYSGPHPASYPMGTGKF